MEQALFEIALIWFAFVLVFFTEHIKNIYYTLQPNPFAWQRWWAVIKGTFTKRTAFPLTVMVLLTIAVYLLNFWQTNDLIKAENERNAELLQTVNQTINEQFDKRDEKLDALIERIDNLITALEAQNVSDNTTATN